MELKNLPKLSPTFKRDVWKVAEDWEILNHVVKAGFMTDLDSIPRIPIIHAILKGRARSAALLHDYLYRYGGVTREEADKLFSIVMKAERVHPTYRRIIYITIRGTGWLRWNQLRKRQP